jgi:lysozyme
MYDITPKKRGWTFKSLAGTVAVFGVVVSPFVSSFKSETHTAYRNESGKPSICFGHTKNVKMSDKATLEQCKQFLEDDFADAITFVTKQTPEIVDRTDTLKAASEYVFRVNKESYLKSPMLAHFKAGRWVEGCKSFAGYNIHNHYKFKRIGKECNKLRDGKWRCKEPELVLMRNREMKLCLSTRPGSAL